VTVFADTHLSPGANPSKVRMYRQIRCLTTNSNLVTDLYFEKNSVIGAYNPAILLSDQNDAFFKWIVNVFPCPVLQESALQIHARPSIKNQV
jgi:hypothetical protein